MASWWTRTVFRFPFQLKSTFDAFLCFSSCIVCSISPFIVPARMLMNNCASCWITQSLTSALLTRSVRLITRPSPRLAASCSQQASVSSVAGWRLCITSSDYHRSPSSSKHSNKSQFTRLKKANTKQKQFLWAKCASSNGRQSKAKVIVNIETL